jgi:hypothetical protein
MKIGLLPDDVKPRIHGARTQWIRGFMAFRWTGAPDRDVGGADVT